MQNWFPFFFAFVVNKEQALEDHSQKAPLVWDKSKRPPSISIKTPWFWITWKRFKKSYSLRLLKSICTVFFQSYFTIFRICCACCQFLSLLDRAHLLIVPQCKHSAQLPFMLSGHSCTSCSKVAIGSNPGVVNSPVTDGFFPPSPCLFPGPHSLRHNSF